MKKMIVIAALTFVIAVAGGLGAAMVLGPGPAAPGTPGTASEPGPSADHASREAALAGFGSAGRDAPAGAPPETQWGAASQGKTPASDGAPAGEAGTSVPGSGSASSPPHAGGEGNGGEAPMLVEFIEVGRILGAMEPREVARFLAHLSDPETLRILRSMRVSKAAEALDALPKSRADQLKRRLLEVPEQP